MSYCIVMFGISLFLGKVMFCRICGLSGSYVVEENSFHDRRLTKKQVVTPMSILSR
jgi:hypothetical protein